MFLITLFEYFNRFLYIRGIILEEQLPYLIFYICDEYSLTPRRSMDHSLTDASSHLDGALIRA